MKFKHWVKGAAGLAAFMAAICGYFAILVVAPPLVAVVVSVLPLVGVLLFCAAKAAQSHEEISALRREIKAREDARHAR